MKVPIDKDFFQSKNHFFYLTALVFVFMSTTALSMSGKIPEVITGAKINQKTVRVFPSVPVLSTDYFPTVSAQGVLAVDIDSGVSLYEKNPDKKLLPASTTKIVTAITAMEYFLPDQILTVPAIGVVGQKMGLYAGEQMSFKNLLTSLLVFSANDAAEVVAANYCSLKRNQDYTQDCGRQLFIEAMNEKARELSMTNSNFQNPVGLDGDMQYTTARDLIRVSEVAMRNPDFAQIVGTKQVSITDITGKSNYNLRNINTLLDTVPGVMGVKTGWTENARENLVTYLERDGRRIMIAVLGSQDRFGETRELIDWIFESYSWEDVSVSYSNF
jgi:serine-type D-Ala-D-Ala carboxypeptidase (penicillin-binding protein 5/6)